MGVWWLAREAPVPGASSVPDHARLVLRSRVGPWAEVHAEPGLALGVGWVLVTTGEATWELQLLAAPGSPAKTEEDWRVSLGEPMEPEDKPTADCPFTTLGALELESLMTESCGEMGREAVEDEMECAVWRAWGFREERLRMRLRAHTTPHSTCYLRTEHGASAV